MLRRHFVVPSLAAMMFALAACQDASDSSVNATTHEDSTDAGSDSGSTQSMNTGAGETCADATPLAATTLVNQHTTSGGDLTTTCEDVGAPQHFYIFELPAHERATVHVAPEDGVIIARALTSCGTSGCFHTERSSVSGDDLTLVFENNADATVTRYVSVSAATAGATITFDIRLDLAPIVPPPAGETCTDATPLAATTLVNQHTASGGDRNAVCENVDAPQHFYSFVLPAHQRATIHVAPELGAIVARAMAGCGETSCLTDSTSDGDVTLVIDSPGDEPLTKIIAVSAATAGATITFDIRLDLTPLPADGS